MAEHEQCEDVRVRAATRQDMPLLHQMIQELAAYEGYPNGPCLSVDDLVKDGFESTPPWFFGLVAEEGGGGGGGGGGALGFALCTRAYSSWTRHAFYLEDLFVRPAARRRGVGRALMRHLAQMGVAEGVTRVDWHVLESNASACAFYSRLGARDLRVTEGRAALRWDEAAMRALAAAPPASWPALTHPAHPPNGHTHS